MQNKNINSEKITEILSSYKETRSVPKTSKVVNIGINTIYKILKENNIKIERGLKRYRCNHNFFDEIDTEEKAYWLGFHIGDGHASTKYNKWKIKLSIIDEGHLKKLVKCLDSDYPVKIRTEKERYFGDRRVAATKSCVLEMVSPVIVKALERFELVNNRVLTTKIPEIRADLVRHMIRGLFDADGGIAFQEQKKENAHFYIVGTEQVCIKVNKIIEKILNKNISNAIKNKKDSKIFSFSIGGSNQVYNILQWMYTDASIYLDRKYEKAKRFIKLHQYNYENSANYQVMQFEEIKTNNE